MNPSHHPQIVSPPPEFSEINDIRQASELRSYSFSNFKKTQVCDELTKSIYRGKIEQACYWSAELICAGHYYDLWDEIVNYYSKYIHLANPKIAIYLARRYQIFTNIVSQGHFITELQLRNNDTVRRLFAEVICILIQSDKKQCYEPVKIIREEEYDINNLSERLAADTTEYVNAVFEKDDAKELVVALNEFAFYLNGKHKNMNNACFWLEWTIDFTALCKSKKQELKCERRPYPVNPKYQKESIWLIWDLIFEECSRTTASNLEGIQDILQALLSLFCIKYTSGTSKKRRHLLYFAVSLLVEPNQTTCVLMKHRDIIERVVDDINHVYKQIKKNEISPKTDYLYTQLGGGESNANKSFEQTVKKLELAANLHIP